MAHIGSSQSERRKFGLDQSESRISPMWLIDVTTIVLAHVTPPEVTPQSPGSDRATGSDLATSPQSPEVNVPPEVTATGSQPWTSPQSTGSGCATGSQEVVPLNCFIAQCNNWSLYLCWML